MREFIEKIERDIWSSLNNLRPQVESIIEMCAEHFGVKINKRKATSYRTQIALIWDHIDRAKKRARKQSPAKAMEYLRSEHAFRAMLEPAIRWAILMDAQAANMGDGWVEFRLKQLAAMGK